MVWLRFVVTVIDPVLVMVLDYCEIVVGLFIVVFLVGWLLVFGGVFICEYAMVVVVWVYFGFGDLGMDVGIILCWFVEL